MNTFWLYCIAVGTMAFAILTAMDSEMNDGFLMWFQRSLAVASALTSATCLGLVIWRLAA